MKITLSIIKADIASIGGHVCPSPQLLSTVQTPHIACSVHVDHFASSTGGDIAVPMTHTHGLGHKAIHQADLRRLLAGTGVAKKQDLCGAGQDLLKDAFSGIVRGMGPTVAEMEFNEVAGSLHDGQLTEPAEAFAHPFWYQMRGTISDKAIGMRQQGFFGAAMLLMAELEYTGIMENLTALEPRFHLRTGA